MISQRSCRPTSPIHPWPRSAAATRVVAAERIQPHYATLALPDKVRKEFESIAQKMLTATQYEMLRPRPKS